MSKARIMIDQDSKALEITTKAFDGFDFVTVTSTQAAQYEIMEDGIELSLIGIHFDESRAIELVSFNRADESSKRPQF